MKSTILSTADTEVGRYYRRAALGLVVLASLLMSSMSRAAEIAVTDINFSSKPGSIFEIKVDFNGVPPVPNTYTIEKPARISMDFANTVSELDRKKFSLPYGNATGVLVLESGERTRMIVNLVKLVPYETRIEGNSLIIEVGNEGAAEYLKEVQDPNIMTAPAMAADRAESTIESLEFQRSDNGEGRVMLSLTDPNVDVNVFSEAGVVKVEFLETTARKDLERRYDVTDFATPVSSLELARTERGVTVSMVATGHYDYLAYQTDNQYVVSVKPLTEREVEARKNEFSYIGDRLSLNFQDIEVRAVLQLIADFTELNLVASDTVAGRITLRLQNVPWDQALELVLKTKGLDKRQVGNVLMVAPAAEIAERERQEIEANKQIAELAPLQTEFLRIRYASAANIVGLFGGGGGDGGEEGSTASLISPRGSVIVDERTNSLLITDTAAKLTEVRDLIELVDIPIRQVMIEARIVIAQSDVAQSLGIRWGGAGLNIGNDSVTSYSGDLDNVTTINQDVIDGSTPEASFPGALLVDLGVAAANGSFAVGYASNDLFLAAELSALENAGSGEVVSQPKVITGDKQQATIKSGTEVPFQESSANGETTTSFKEAVLALEVTPNITPDDRILLDLVINQDSVGDLVPSGAGGFIPSIDTTQLTTQVLVGNGETVVLGGVFRTEDVDSTSKVPFLGDIPYVGRLFKSTSLQKTKTETLIFITPRILAETLLD
jgi:type IV pilus assembly protein PilQ